MSLRLSRRTVLRGAGAAVALPLLEAMMPAAARAAALTPKPPVRLAFFMVPNGIHMPAWTPAEEGAGFALTPTLAPLAKVRDSISILTGLTQHNADPLGDGPGDHARSAAVWLTGIHPRKTAGADISAGVSVDQIAAMNIGQRTPFPSLELGCEPSSGNGDCDSGYACAYSSNIAWSAPDQPVAKEIDPHAVFARLFGDPDSNASPQALQMRNQDRLSILDFVMGDAKSLSVKLGRRDRSKLDEYMTGVRELEVRLSRSRNAEKIASDAGMSPPIGIPDDYGEHIRLMCDMLVLAFQTDTTRVSTFMLANEASNRSFDLIGIPEGHHDLSHHGGIVEKQRKLQLINEFQIAQLAYFLEKLDSIEEPNGTLLDNSFVVFGGGISDGNRHNHDDLPCLLAGRGGGALDVGRHIVYPDYTPMTNLFVSMLDRAGVRTDNFGDSTGRLQYLF